MSNLPRRYSEEEMAIIRANAAMADLEREALHLPMAFVPDQLMAPELNDAAKDLDYAFHATGGRTRFALWADKNYEEFIKLYVNKRVQKTVDVNVKKGIEDILDVIDQEAVDAEYEDVVDR